MSTVLRISSRFCHRPMPGQHTGYRLKPTKLAQATPDQFVQHILYDHLCLDVIGSLDRPVASWDIAASRHIRVALDWVVIKALRYFDEPVDFFLNRMVAGGHLTQDPDQIRVPLVKNLRFIQTDGLTTPAVRWNRVWAFLEHKFPGSSAIEVSARDLQEPFRLETDVE